MSVNWKGREMFRMGKKRKVSWMDMKKVEEKNQPDEVKFSF